MTSVPAHTAPATTPLPEGKRLAFGWPVAEATVDRPAVLRFDAPPAGDGSQVELRLTNAWDTRQPLFVTVSLAGSGEVVGEINASYAPVFVPQGCLIDRRLLKRVLQQGLALKVREGELPFRFHIASPQTPPALAAQLLLHDGRGTVADALDRVASLGSIQMFGWEEGCVVDALEQLHAATGDDRYARALDDHWRLFLDGDRIRWEFTQNTIHDGQVVAIESTLMYASLARRRPDHPLLAEVEAFWRSREDSAGCVLDTMTSTEGCYTVAYPMAVFAAAAERLGDRDRADRLRAGAVRQLDVRIERLSTPEGVFLRRYADGRTTHFNWSRGLAWYLLGLVRTLALLPPADRPPRPVAELDRVARWALSKRDVGGLLHCFAGEPETGLETSGIAGVCAAIATGCDEGLLDPSLREQLMPTWAALQQWLTPDGLLKGIAPSNRAGEPYQRTGVRVMSPFGLGLWAQFAARMIRRP
jgi:rhamnogalacturonyl hydrolase YesR